MILTRVSIRRFRCLVDVELTLDKATVLVGENSAGKTSVLDALRFALGRRWGTRGTGFTEYDFHLESEKSDPKTCEPIVIDLFFDEPPDKPWDSDLKSDLDSEIVIDARTRRNRIALRCTSKYDPIEEKYATRWVFLDSAGNEMGAGRTRSANTSALWRWLPLFHLPAIRDVSTELSIRGQFWPALLRAINIPEASWTPIKENVERVNSDLVAADPKLGEIREQLRQIKGIVAPGTFDSVDIQALPLKLWDLLAKTDVIGRSGKSQPWLPISRHGHGIQSLAVVSVFRAFVDHALSEDYEPESEPVLLMEEPETHLHPHAARAFYEQIDSLPGQKVITSHSPFFLEDVPVSAIRLLRRREGKTHICVVRRSATAFVPSRPELADAVSKSRGQLSFDATTGALVAQGPIPDRMLRRLLTVYSSVPDRAEVHPKLRKLSDESITILEDDDVLALRHAVSRLRGELFYARLWIIVEGESDLEIASMFLEREGVDIDRSGITVINAQMCGSPALFVSAARALEFPWILFRDGDSGGENIARSIIKRGVEAKQLREASVSLPGSEGQWSLERYLVSNGWSGVIRDAITTRDAVAAKELAGANDIALVAFLEAKSKPLYARYLLEHVNEMAPEAVPATPDAFKELAEKVKKILGG